MIAPGVDARWVIILTRILVPEDSRIDAKARTINTFLQRIIKVGLEKTLIRDKVVTRDHYDTAWTVRLVRDALQLPRPH